MKGLSVIFIILFSFHYSLYAQDTIVRKNGTKIICKIQKEDSTTVYFTLAQGGRIINTFLNKSDIESFRIKEKKVVSKPSSETISQEFPIPTFNTITHFQDTIVRKNGTKIICKIQKEDSTVVYYTFRNKGENITTYLSKNDISSLYYKDIRDASSSLSDTTAGKKGKTNRENAASPYDVISVGAGLGLDFGGLGGGNILAYLDKSLGLFFGVGNALAGAGVNGGIKLRLAQDVQKTGLYIIVMYGYNTAIVVKNAPQYNKLFYGPTAGCGLDVHFGPKDIAYLSFAFLVPIRNAEVNSYIDGLKNNINAKFENNLYPFAISASLRLVLGRKK